jgi:hypothetical protein
VLLAFALSKDHLVAIRISYNHYPYLFAPHDGFGLNSRSLESLDAIIKIGLDERHDDRPASRLFS